METKTDRPPTLRLSPVQRERLLSEVVRYLRAEAHCEGCLRHRSGSPAQTRLLNAINYPRD